jgi:thiaminase/transcriptional activator TenA
MTAPPDYGRAFGLWRDAAGETWRDYTRHAFVEGLRDGTLPRPAFLRYLAQDYIFLIHFSRAWALAVAKAETLEEMRVAASTVNALVNDETRLHVEICAAEGVSEQALFEAEELPENLAYTRYVLEAGYSGDFLDLVAALAPCVLGYGEIGLRLAGADAATPYRAWIDTYAGDGYQEVCRGVGRLIDGAAERRLGADFDSTARWPRLAARFRTATRLEVGFWDMGLGAG